MTDATIEKLSKETIKHFLYVIIVSSFWGLSIFITKPILFNQPFLIQVFILFCLSFVWCFISSIIGIIVEIILIRLKVISKTILMSIRIELYLLIGVIIKCFFILFAYYYSLSFTEYLQFVIKWSILGITFLCLTTRILKKLKKASKVE